MSCISKELLEIPFKFVRYIIAYIKQQVNRLPVAAGGRSALCNGIKNLPSLHASDSDVEGSLIMVLSIGAMPRRGNDRWKNCAFCYSCVLCYRKITNLTH